MKCSTQYHYEQIPDRQRTCFYFTIDLYFGTWAGKLCYCDTDCLLTFFLEWYKLMFPVESTLFERERERAREREVFWRGHFDIRTFALRAVMRECKVVKAIVESCKGKQRKGEYATTTKRKVAKKSAKVGRWNPHLTSQLCKYAKVEVAPS